jgi:hypothetical protein
MIGQLPIFPCNIDKSPLIVHGFKSAQRGAKWKGWPLVGFRTGAASGIDVLDIDPDGRKWFDQNIDAIPQTRAHETQRGLHLLFKHAEGLRCSTSRIADGVDVRADGGYAIYWPTTGRPIEDHPISEWPNWLLAEAMGKDNPFGTPRHSLSLPHDPVLAADCTTALRKMSAEDWRGQWAEWFELLMGCKAVGIALADFTEWCVSDPKYADEAEEIARQWHSVEPKHGGAFWRELSKRKVRIGQPRMSGVPNGKPNSSSTVHRPTRNPDARLNYITNKICENPTERALFSWACLAAEIVHECKRKPSQIMCLLEGAATITPLWETLGREGIHRTISNAFRKVEEKYLTEEES